MLTLQCHFELTLMVRLESGKKYQFWFRIAHRLARVTSHWHSHSDTVLFIKSQKTINNTNRDLRKLNVVDAIQRWTFA